MLLIHQIINQQFSNTKIQVEEEQETELFYKFQQLNDPIETPSQILDKKRTRKR